MTQRPFVAAMFLAIASLNVASIAIAQPDRVAPQRPIERIVFGSCAKQEQPVPIFETMARERPDIAIFTGDNIYGDTADISVLRRKYQTLGSKPEFKSLADSCRLMATWDDHDFGVNDGGSDFALRAESQKAFLDFWNVPNDSPRRDREGVYHAETFGPLGQRVQVILLDTRYHRSPLKKGERRVGGPYYPDDDPTKTMLGERQWHWFEQQLDIPADLRVIVSSIQFVASDSGQECWSNLPRERQRMLNMLEATGASGVVFVSGDRHWSEASSLQRPNSYPIYDITSSSFNQIHERGSPTENRFRHLKTTYHRENYGLLEIRWSDDPELSFHVRDIDGSDVLSLSLRRSELQAN